MNPALVASLIQLLEQVIPLGVSVYKQLQDAGQTTIPLEDLLAQANANADAIIAAANKELGK